MKYILLFIAFVAAGCITQRVFNDQSNRQEVRKEALAQTTHALATARSPSQEYDYETSFAEGGLTDLTFDELKNILSKNKFSKIEDLLMYLKENKSMYMSHYTLGYASMSLHESSKQFPRAIVFGTTGNFIITFNGHSKQSAYDMLEVVEFNKQKKEFEYREIQFNDLNQLPKGKAYQISQVGGPEGKCLQCHTNSRPIWESYPVWPGFYGAQDDEPIGRSDRTAELGQEPLKHIKDWEWFAENGFKQARYRALQPMAESIFVSSNGIRPNTDLTIVLGKMNAQRIARIIKKHIRPDFKYAYLAAMVCNRDRIPKALQAIFNEYNPKYETASINHQVYRSQRLLTELGYDIAEFRAYWDTQYEVYQRAPTLPYSKDATLFQFLTGMLTQQKYYTMASSIVKPFAIVAGMTEKYFPQAQPETWPSALYEGVYKYDTGVAAELTDLRAALVEEFFPKDEWEKLKTLRESEATCDELVTHFPKELTDLK